MALRLADDAGSGSRGPSVHPCFKIFDHWESNSDFERRTVLTSGPLTAISAFATSFDKLNKEAVFSVIATVSQLASSRSGERITSWSRQNPTLLHETAHDLEVSRSLLQHLIRNRTDWRNLPPWLINSLRVSEPMLSFHLPDLRTSPAIALTYARGNNNTFIALTPVQDLSQNRTSSAVPSP